jgi:hypothetical protein
VRAVVHAGAISARHGVGELVFARLLHDSVELSEHADRAVDADGVADLDRARGGLLGLDGLVVLEALLVGEVERVRSRGLITQSGTAQSNCWTSSAAIVFWPSMRSEFIEFAR